MRLFEERRLERRKLVVEDEQTVKDISLKGRWLVDLRNRRVDRLVLL
jgi:hypothetical protein